MAGVDAGKLNRRLGVLSLVEQAGGLTWDEGRKTWAMVELTGKSNLFSRVGMGARDALITMRRQPLTLHNALMWGTAHLFLTEITEPAPDWLEVRAALVDVVMCTAGAETDTPGPLFPGVLTEKYVGHRQEVPMAELTVRLVLVTPKSVTLVPGSLVEVARTPYQVLVPHELDPYKNEYEIERGLDC